MADQFEMRSEDLKKLKKFFRKSPRLIKPVQANLITSLAFKTREYDIQNISSEMIIRNERFVKSSIRVTKATTNDLNAFVYSIRRPRFSGWEEQQTGKPSRKKKTPTLHARRGNRAGKIPNKFKFRSKSKFYNPSMFKGKTYKQRFYFMLRVLGSRGGGEFLLNNDVELKKGKLKKGLYSFRRHSISKIQDTTRRYRTKKFKWRTKSLQDLQQKNNLNEMWAKSINFILSRQGLKKS